MESRKKLELIAVLPFKPLIQKVTLTTTFRDMIAPVSIDIDPTNELIVVPMIKHIDTSHMLKIKLTTEIIHNGDEESLRLRMKDEKELWKLIECINTTFFIIKYNNFPANETNNIKSIGVNDLLFYCLIIDGEPIENGWNSSFNGDNPIYHIEIKEDQKIPSNEWFTLVRAVELIDRGYSSEGLLIGFSLLDSAVQDHMKLVMKNLESDEKDELMRTIESKRLKIYLGVLHKLATGTSILDSDNISSDVKWLNDKRNDVIHNGKDCKREDAMKSISIIVKIMKKLNAHGSNYEIPVFKEI